MVWDAVAVVGLFDCKQHQYLQMRVHRIVYERRYSSLGKIQGGVFMLRPCLTMARHMMALATSHAELQFRYAHAEQDFLDWCAF